MLYRWCCSFVGVTPGLAVAAGGQVVFQAPGVCPAPPLWLWALCSCCFFPWCQGVVSCFYLVALRAVWCLVCCFISAAPVRVGCFLSSPAVWALFVCSRSCVVGLRPWAGSPSWSVCLLGFPAVICAVHLFPLLRLFVATNTKACFCVFSHFC